jgi:hypothetical protein
MSLHPPRPNTLSEEAAPNVLSVGTPVAAGRPAGATSPVRPVQAPPTATRRGTRSRGNPARGLILFLVFGFFAFARLSNLGSGLGGGSFGDQPTTQPAAEEPTTVPNYGFIDFGTSVGDHCVLSNMDKVFPVGTHVYWWAHLGLNQRSDQTVVWFLSFNDTEIDKGTGPSDHPTSTWDGICGDQPLLDQGAGTYRLEIWDPDKTVLLATGTYVLEPVSSPIASHEPTRGPVASSVPSASP